MRIVVFIETYLPAFRSGGAVRAIAGLVERLGDEHEFYIFAGDGDRESGPHPGITPGNWVRLGKARVYYASRSALLPHHLARVVSAIEPDAYYVNSFFSPAFAAIPVLLRRMGVLPKRPMMLAPRGEISAAALGVRGAKKRAFILLAQTLSAYRDLEWHAGTEEERHDILGAFPRARVTVVRDLTEPRAAPASTRPRKLPGALRLAYLSRITPVKNLAYALRLLGRIQGHIRFSVYGGGYESGYRSQCVKEAGRLPRNVHVEFEGAVPHERVLSLLAGEHAFLLPTAGESFGHAIVDALLAGCIPIISNRTRWKGLEAAGLGWDLPLEDEVSFVRAIQACVDMDSAEFERRSSQVQRFGLSVAESALAVDDNRALLERLRPPVAAT